MSAIPLWISAPTAFLSQESKLSTNTSPAMAGEVVTVHTDTYTCPKAFLMIFNG